MAIIDCIVRKEFFLHLEKRKETEISSNDKEIKNQQKEKDKQKERKKHILMKWSQTAKQKERRTTELGTRLDSQNQST